MGAHGMAPEVGRLGSGGRPGATPACLLPRLVRSNGMLPPLKRISTPSSLTPTTAAALAVATAVAVPPATPIAAAVARAAAAVGSRATPALTPIPAAITAPLPE